MTSESNGGCTREQHENAPEESDELVMLLNVERNANGISFPVQGTNSTLQEVFDSNRSDADGHTLIETFGPERGKTMKSRATASVESGDPMTEMIPGDDSADRNDWQVRFTPITTNGSISNIVCIGREITDGLPHDESWSAEYGRLKTLFQEAPDGIIIHDVEGQVLDVNETMVAKLGYDRDEFRQLSVHDFEIGIEPTELRSRWEAMAPGSVHRLEVSGVHQRKDGSTYPVDVWVSKVESESQESARFIALVRDVSDRKERERKLQRLRAYLESATDIVTLIDSEGVIEYVSPAANRVLGYEPADLRGANGAEFIHPDDRQSVRNALETLLETPEAETVLEFRFRCRDGDYCWIESTARNLLTDPDVGGILLSSRDISERKQHERRLAALHEATRQLINAESHRSVAETAIEAAEELLDFSLPSVWFVEDDELRLVANSNEHQRLLEEAGEPNPVHGSESWLWEVVEAEAAITRSPLESSELAADVPLRSAILVSLGDHGILACAARGEVSFSDRQIEVVEILARNLRGALDQLDQRNAVQRHQEFTTQVLDALDDVVYILEPNGALRDWNEALEEVTGYDGTEIEQMNAADFFAPADSETAAAAVTEAVETGQTRLQLEFQTKAGERIPYEFIANAFTDVEGRTVVAGIGRDRSQHVEYERQLEEQRDNLEILNQVVRHDIRNDMTIARGRAKLLEDHVDGDEREHLESVIRATENTIELTRTAREIAALELSREADARPVSLDRHLNTQIEEQRTKFERAVVTVSEPIPQLTVLANELLETVFRNLLQNAIIHNDKEIPRVEVSVEVEAETVTVAIADNGPGIPDSQKDEIFGRGKKGLESPGTGIGLYLVRRLVDRYGGHVAVTDNEPEGSVFTVTLPRTDE